VNSRFCENGEQFNIGTVECEPCPVDTYDNENSALDVCAVCPDGQGTRGEGSVGDEESACFSEFCLCHITKFMYLQNRHIVFGHLRVILCHPYPTWKKTDT